MSHRPLSTGGDGGGTALDAAVVSITRKRTCYVRTYPKQIVFSTVLSGSLARVHVRVVFGIGRVFSRGRGHMDAHADYSCTHACS